MTKPTKGPVQPAKTQINLHIQSESSLCTLLVAKDIMLLQAHNEDSDQTGRMPTLICVGAHVFLLVLSCCGSYVLSLNRDIYLKHR